MSNILILGKPGSGKTTYISNLYGVYNEKHLFDKNPKSLDGFSILFDSDDAISLKRNYKLIKGKKEVQATIAYQEFKCALYGEKDRLLEFTLCDNRGGITRQMNWGDHFDWINKLIDLIKNDTNGVLDYDFDAVVFVYDCAEFKDSGELFVDKKQIEQQLKVLAEVAKEANKPVFLIFSKKDCLNREDMNYIDEVFTDALGPDSYLNKIFLQLNDASSSNRGKIAVPIIYILRKLYMNSREYNYELADKLRQYCMHISNI